MKYMFMVIFKGRAGSLLIQFYQAGNKPPRLFSDALKTMRVCETILAQALIEGV